MTLNTIVIDYDRGHFYDHLKKSNYDEIWARDMYLNVCLWDEFRAARNDKKMKFLTFQAQPASVRVISVYFLCKSSFRVIFQW